MSTHPIRAVSFRGSDELCIRANPEPASKLEQAPNNPLSKRTVTQIDLGSSPTKLSIIPPTIESEIENDRKEGLDTLRICPTEDIVLITPPDPRDERRSTLVSLMH